MADFDHTRIARMAETLESGSTEEKLALLDDIDRNDPIAVGMLMRALLDPASQVRLHAIERLEHWEMRPPQLILRQLKEDPEEPIREVADRLEDFPEAVNPLEEIVPLVESLADSLGPFGGLLRNMISTMRNLGETDERTQLVTLSQLDSANPAAMVALPQALQSPFISVRLAALKKALDLDNVTLSEEQIRDFLADPSPELRAAAEALVRADKIKPFDSQQFRTAAAENMIQNLMGSMNLGNLNLGDLFKTGADSAPKGSPGDGGIGNLFGNLLGNLGSLMGQAEEEDDPPPDHSTKEHPPAGHIYIMGEQRIRDRILRTLERISLDETHPPYCQLDMAEQPARWAIESVPDELTSPGWVELIEDAGFELPLKVIIGAEQARLISEQVWGAAFADHSSDKPITLVFHDGILSRSEWSGAQPGSWSTNEPLPAPGSNGPLALLSAFLRDPTDDKLVLSGNQVPTLRIRNSS